jgi:catechol 2,3-dioxygenase-like lactoylglutathione lyase family enzyme
MLYKIIILVAMAVILFSTACVIFVQSSRELRFGTWVSGTLTEGEEKWLNLRPPGPGFVIVETSGNIDTYLEIYDATGNIIAEDDDGGEDLNARVEIFVEAGQAYRTKVSLFGDKGGPYRIRAIYEPLLPDMERNTERARAIPLKLGETIPVYLRVPYESRWYQYEITQAGASFIVQTRGKMDTILSLYDAQGNLIKEDDDSGENFNAYLSERIGPGTVYIEVKEYEGQTGRCTLYTEIR